MAKGRKPAIDGLARPQGILDDVVYPLVQKAARKVANKAMTGTSKKSYRTYSRALQVEDTMRLKREKSYRKKAANIVKKNTPAKGGAMGGTEKARQKAMIQAYKASAVQTNNSVRKTAKSQRQWYRNRYK
jgi:hypothetical protein